MRGYDFGGFADEAQATIAADVHFPPGYHVEYGGQFENLRRALSADGDCYERGRGNAKTIGHRRH
jgi:hypothetical protein